MIPLFPLIVRAHTQLVLTSDRTDFWCVRTTDYPDFIIENIAMEVLYFSI